MSRFKFFCNCKNELGSLVFTLLGKLFFFAGFVSTVIGQAFDILVDFNQGFKKAQENVTVLNTIGPVSEEFMMKIIFTVNPGPEFIITLANRLEAFLLKKEESK